MAAKSQSLVFEVKAEADQAKKALDQIEKQGKLLEKGVEVPLTLEGASKASSDLSEAATQARALATVLQHTPGMGDVADEAARSAKELEGAAKEAKKVESALRDIEGVPPPDPKAGGATEQMQTLERSASGTKNAFANLVGNTAQDLSGLGGAFSSVGVAIGQVAEYTADAANEGGGLKAALSGAASFAGPMLALSAAAFAVQKVMGDMAKKSQEAKAANEALLSSFVDGVGILDDWGSSLDDAFSAGTATSIQDFNKFIKDMLKTTGDLDKTAVAIGQVGGSLDDMGEAVKGADDNFVDWASHWLESQGFLPQAARDIAEVVSANDKLGDALDVVNTNAERNALSKWITPEQKAHLDDYVRGLSQFSDIAEKTDIAKKAKETNDLAKAQSEYADVVDKGRAAGESELQITKDVTQAKHEKAQAEQEAARATEEGAKASADSGTILDQVNRQLSASEENLAKATKKVSDEQDKWLGTTITLPAAQDDLSESVISLTEQLQKQAKAGDEGAGSFEGQTKAALDNRDAQRDVYQQAFDVIDIMGKQGATTGQLAAATKEMADRAYNLALANGASEQQAAALRDTILTVPTSRSTEMTYAENNYGTMIDHRDALAEDIKTTVYFHGVVDSELQRFIQNTPGLFAGASSAPLPPAGPAMGLRAVGAPVAAPLALAAPRVSRAVTVAQPVVVNVNAGIVADTFQLQRAVARSARSFERIAGKRAAA